MIDRAILHRAAAAVATTTPPRTAQATEHPCQLAKYHAPKPVITEYHHTKPVFLQNALYGRILYPADLWLCSNCHEAVHAWLYYRLSMRQKPARMGRAAKEEAERTYAWFLAEEARKEAEEDILAALKAQDRP